MADIVVGVNTVGKCEYCNFFLSPQIMHRLTGGLCCPTCKKVISIKSLGWEKVDGVWKKAKWLDENGNWTTTKPKKNYVLKPVGWRVEIFSRPLEPQKFH